MEALLAQDQAREKEFFDDLSSMRNKFEQVHDQLKSLRQQHNDQPTSLPASQDKNSDELIEEKCTKLRDIFTKLDEEMKKFRKENMDLKHRILLPIAQGKEFEEAIIDELEENKHRKGPSEKRTFEHIDLRTGVDYMCGKNVSGPGLEILRLRARLHQVEPALTAKKQEFERMKIEFVKQLQEMKGAAKSKISGLEEMLRKETERNHRLQQHLHMAVQKEIEKAQAIAPPQGHLRIISEEIAHKQFEEISDKEIKQEPTD